MTESKTSPSLYDLIAPFIKFKCSICGNSVDEVGITKKGLTCKPCLTKLKDGRT